MALKTGKSASVADRFHDASCISSMHFNTESLAEKCKAARLSRKRFHAEANRAQEIITAFTNSAERLDCNGLENSVLRKGRVVATLACSASVATAVPSLVARREPVCTCKVTC